MLQLHFEKPWPIDEVRNLRQQNLVAAEEAGLQKTDAYNLAFVADELISNIIDHSDATWIDYDLGFERGQPRLVLKDNGAPFDLTDPEKISPTSDRGLGLTMIVQMISVLRYRRDQSTNVVTVETATGQTMP